MDFTRERLQEVINRAAFSDLIGTIENDWFECKSQPYALDRASGKRELAKDVSSFANHQGGHILIGLKTRTSTAFRGDEVEAIRSFEQSVVDLDRYHNVLGEWVYPEIENIAIRWVAENGSSDKGIVVISIPQQKEALKPFLITRVVDEEKKSVEIIFGYAERKRDRSQPMSVVDLQRSLRAGFNYENTMAERFSSVEALLSGLVSDNANLDNQERFAQLVDERIQGIMSNLDRGRHMIITAYPRVPGQLLTIFTSGEHSLKSVIVNPPYLRDNGWNLPTGGRAEIVRGEFVTTGGDDYDLLNVYRDGTVVLAVRADEYYLARPTSLEEQRINSIALVETVYNFAQFYGRVLEDFDQKPDYVFIRVVLRNLHLDEVKTYLLPYSPAQWEFGRHRDEARFAPENEMTKVIRADANNFIPTVASFDLIKEIYLWFGFGEDKIPFSMLGDDRGRIDPNQIMKLGA